MKYLMPDWAYDIAKWVGLIFCPALATFIGAIGPAWEWSGTDKAVLTVNALGIFIGALIGLSQLSAKGDGNGVG